MCVCMCVCMCVYVCVCVYMRTAEGSSSTGVGGVSTKSGLVGKVLLANADALCAAAAPLLVENEDINL